MSESTIKYERGDDGIVVLTLDDPNQSANTMNEAYVRSMGETVDRLASEVEAGDVKGVILTSAKRPSFAGGVRTTVRVDPLFGKSNRRAFGEYCRSTWISSLRKSMSDHRRP